MTLTDILGLAALVSTVLAVGVSLYVYCGHMKTEAARRDAEFEAEIDRLFEEG